MNGVLLDLGHTGAGKPPALHAGMSERRIVWRYAMRAADVLDREGIEVSVAGWGRYHERQVYAARRGLVFVSCHVNAGYRHDWPVRGSIFYRTTGPSRDLALALSGPLAALAGGSKCWHATPSSWPGPSALLERVGTGVVYEPGFLDCAAHAHLWQGDGPDRLGDALASGLLAYLRGRR